MKDSQRPLLGTWASSTLLLLAAVAVVALVWGLAQQNLTLKRALALRDSPAEAFLQPGAILPSVPMLSLDGEPRAISDLGSRGAVVAFFNTTCPFCESSLPVWTHLNAKMVPDGLPLAGISLHGRVETENFVSLHEIPWPVWVLENPSDRTKLGISAVPFTIPISASGEVTQTWRGALTDADVTEIYESSMLQTARGSVSGWEVLGTESCCTASLKAARSAKRSENGEDFTPGWLRTRK